MDAEFHRRVRQVFDEALERPGSERRTFIEAASKGDEALLEAVERLLHARGLSESFLDTPVSHAAQIGRYLILGELGRGAMGVVYDAVDPMISRPVALKVISLKAGMDASEAGFLKERLFKEARSAGRLFHPGIVVILDVGVQGDGAFITMERVEGPSLQQLLASGRRLDSPKAIDIVRQTAAALDYAHDHAVVHRDIKPANIMLQGGVTVKVADFGIAKLMSTQNLTLTGMLMGTPSYMSPEQIEARAVDGRSDQFSLAVLAFQLLTGALPFQADSMPTLAHLIVYGPRPSAHVANPSLPSAIDRVFERAFSRSPQQRFAQCIEFSRALEEVLLSTRAREDAPDQPHRKPSRATPKRPARYRGYLGAAATVLLAAVGISGAYYANYLRPARRAALANTQLRTRSTAPRTDVLSANPNALGAVETPPISPPVVPPKPVPALHPGEEDYNSALARRSQGKAEQAARLFRQAADLGNAEAMEELGEIYRTGDGLPKDGLEALRWFLRAAAAGRSSAMVSLGALYLLGDNIAQSDEEAVRWFQKAADLKNPDALYDLGTMYEDGQGVSRSLDKAKQLYGAAAELGNPEARRKLVDLEAQK